MNNERFEELKKDFLPRFWDTENNVMIYPELNNYGVEDQVEYQMDKYSKVSLTHMLQNLYDKFIPMRPTGHFDKNNNLIYQDDTIVYYKNGGATCFGGRREAVVKWHEDWCRWIIETEFGDAYGLNERNEPIEIIGNTHEVKE